MIGNQLEKISQLIAQLNKMILIHGEDLSDLLGEVSGLISKRARLKGIKSAHSIN